MGVFHDEAEVHKYIGGVFDKGLVDPELGRKLADSGVILRIACTDPEAAVTVDMPQGKVHAGETGPLPTVELSMTADNANKFWLGKLNLSTAIAMGHVKATGPVSKILKLVPAAKSLFPSYREMLTADGRHDLLDA